MEIFAFVQVFWCPLIVHKVQRIEVVVVVLDVHAAVGAHRRVDTAWRYDQIPLVTFTGYPMRFIHQHRTDDDHPTVWVGRPREQKNKIKCISLDCTILRARI